MNIWTIPFIIVFFLLDEEVFLQSRLSHPLSIAVLFAVFLHYFFSVFIVPAILITLLFFNRKEMGQNITPEAGQFTAIFFLVYYFLIPHIDGITTTIPFVSFLIAVFFSFLSAKTKFLIRKIFDKDSHAIYIKIFIGIVLHSIRYLFFMYLSLICSFIIINMPIDWNRLNLPFIPFVLSIIIYKNIKDIYRALKDKKVYMYFLLFILILFAGQYL